MSSLSQAWEELNHKLRDCDERSAQLLLKQELRGACRITFLLRIHSRLNYLRAHREREELRQKASR